MRISDTIHQAAPVITSDPWRLANGIALFLIFICLAILIAWVYTHDRRLDKHDDSFEEISDFMQVAILSDADLADKIEAVSEIRKGGESGVVRMGPQPKHHRDRAV